MTTIRTLLALRSRALTKFDALRAWALLLGRLSVGLVFLSTGWGKVHSIPKVTEFFSSLHIPAPGFNAVLVGYSELLLVLGLMTRLATIPLIVSMVVAIVTAKRDALHGLFDLVGFDEFTYACVLVMIALLGPGTFSIDALLVRRLEAAAISPHGR
jgi:putative oxidoreductase